MLALLFAVAALLCFALEFFGAGEVEWLVLGFVFVAAWLVVNSAWVSDRLGRTRG